MHLFLSLFSYKCKCVFGHWNRSACILWESDSQWGNQGCSSQPINRLRPVTVLALWTGSLNHGWCHMSNNTAKRAALKTAQTSTVFLAGWMTQQQTTFWRFKLSKSATVPLGDWRGGRVGGTSICTLRVTFIKYKGLKIKFRNSYLIWNYFISISNLIGAGAVQVKEPLFVLSSHLIDVESHEEVQSFSFSHFPAFVTQLFLCVWVVKFEIEEWWERRLKTFLWHFSESYKVLKNNKKIHVIEVKRNHYIRYKLNFISFI